MNGNNRNAPYIGGDSNNGRRANVRAKILGVNGYGAHVFDDDEAEALENELQALYRAASRGMDDRTAALIAGVGRHIQKDTFRGIARRRGGSWRMVSGLADRVNQFEGLALIYLIGGSIGTDLIKQAPIMALETHMQLDGVLALVQHRGSEQTREAMERLIAQLRDEVERITLSMISEYFDDFRRRMGSAPEW